MSSHTVLTSFRSLLLARRPSKSRYISCLELPLLLILEPRELPLALRLQPLQLP